MIRCLPVLLAVVALAACGESNTYVEPPPPKVTVAPPAIQDVTDYLYFTGTTQAAAIVEVRARVVGELKTISFQSGSQVSEGDPLFQIDQREYLADLEIAKAEVSSAKAKKVEADRSLERAQTLIKRGNISQASLDEAEAAARTTAAEVAVKQAALRQAELDLEYTDIRAPISGRVGRNLVDAGNLVGEGEATLLTTITENDPMFVYFNINERDLLLGMEQYRAEAEKAAGTAPSAQGRLRVEMATGDQSDYPFVGILDFAESALNPETGTLQLRASFDNPGALAPLISGLFARVRVPVTERQGLPLVTERAISSDQSGRFIYVLGAENQIEKRSVTIGQLIDGLRVIEEGLSAGEKVVVNGIQRIRAGSLVAPEEAEMAAFTATALGAAQSATR
ncbi:efflux RND transporter periplasmic adaptor subunit [Pelagibius litoralis]|uniref:Efflux RND transporter periplasmic adaptor subunit n=1 Tax=Pelagibius litoralis TaxID=374515 RepID=A0A967EVV2_9PROT|nr:efflux RND transporter periplasmic adaptor subunit [Pelagibius litoralis]NIA69137.1 efflux RND transporter periplasmic adaptor subunit [Pelagibius litoralis]